VERLVQKETFQIIGKNGDCKLFIIKMEKFKNNIKLIILMMFSIMTQTGTKSQKAMMKISIDLMMD
jgi:hypothetical protein